MDVPSQLHCKRPNVHPGGVRFGTAPHCALIGCVQLVQPASLSCPVQPQLQAGRQHLARASRRCALQRELCRSIRGDTLANNAWRCVCKAVGVIQHRAGSGGASEPHGAHSTTWCGAGALSCAMLHWALASWLSCTMIHWALAGSPWSCLHLDTRESCKVAKAPFCCLD